MLSLARCAYKSPSIISRGYLSHEGPSAYLTLSSNTEFPPPIRFALCHLSLLLQEQIIVALEMATGADWESIGKGEALVRKIADCTFTAV